jgi:hypothetical protein
MSRFEFDRAADANGAADANAAQADVGAPVPHTLINTTANAGRTQTSEADANDSDGDGDGDGMVDADALWGVEL